MTTARFGPERRLAPSASFATRGQVLESPLGPTYLAEGDGHYEDHRLFQRMMDDLTRERANQGTGGFSVDVQAGTYRWAGKVLLPERCVISGQGAASLIKPYGYESDGLTAVTPFHAEDADEIVLDGLTFDGRDIAAPALAGSIAAVPSGGTVIQTFPGHTLEAGMDVWVGLPEFIPGQATSAVIASVAEDGYSVTLAATAGQKNRYVPILEKRGGTGGYLFSAHNVRRLVIRNSTFTHSLRHALWLVGVDELEMDNCVIEHAGWGMAAAAWEGTFAFGIGGFNVKSARITRTKFRHLNGRRSAGIEVRVPLGSADAEASPYYEDRGVDHNGWVVDDCEFDDIWPDEASAWDGGAGINLVCARTDRYWNRTQVVNSRFRRIGDGHIWLLNPTGNAVVNNNSFEDGRLGAYIDLNCPAATVIGNVMDKSRDLGPPVYGVDVNLDPILVSGIERADIPRPQAGIRVSCTIGSGDFDNDTPLDFVGAEIEGNVVYNIFGSYGTGIAFYGGTAVSDADGPRVFSIRGNTLVGFGAQAILVQNALGDWSADDNKIQDANVFSLIGGVPDGADGSMLAGATVAEEYVPSTTEFTELVLDDGDGGRWICEDMYLRFAPSGVVNFTSVQVHEVLDDGRYSIWPLNLDYEITLNRPLANEGGWERDTPVQNVTKGVRTTLASDAEEGATTILVNNLADFLGTADEWEDGDQLRIGGVDDEDGGPTDSGPVVGLEIVGAPDASATMLPTIAPGTPVFMPWIGLGGIDVVGNNRNGSAHARIAKNRIGQGQLGTTRWGVGIGYGVTGPLEIDNDAAGCLLGDVRLAGTAATTVRGQGSADWVPDPRDINGSALVDTRWSKYAETIRRSLVNGPGIGETLLRVAGVEADLAAWASGNALTIDGNAGYQISGTPVLNNDAEYVLALDHACVATHRPGTRIVHVDLGQTVYLSDNAAIGATQMRVYAGAVDVTAWINGDELSVAGENADPLLLTGAGALAANSKTFTVTITPALAQDVDGNGVVANTTLGTNGALDGLAVGTRFFTLTAAPWFTEADRVALEAEGRLLAVWVGANSSPQGEVVRVFKVDDAAFRLTLVADPPATTANALEAGHPFVSPVMVAAQPLAARVYGTEYDGAHGTWLGMRWDQDARAFKLGTGRTSTVVDRARELQIRNETGGLIRIMPGSLNAWQWDTGGHFKPSVSNTYNLGASTNLIAALYARWPVIAYSGATPAIAALPGYAMLTRAGVSAATLAAPSASLDGLELTIMSTTAFAHTVTYAEEFIDPAADTVSDVATFGGAIGDAFTLVAYGGKWYVKGARNVTFG